MKDVIMGLGFLVLLILLVFMRKEDRFQKHFCFLRFLSISIEI